MAVSFDSTELITTTYLPRFVKHESVAERSLSTHPLSRSDGEVLVADQYGAKLIRLQGTIRGSSQSDLESTIDSFKELFSRAERSLDIDWAGDIRRYTATCIRHDFDRDHYHLNIVPWTAEFLVPSGEGTDVATTSPDEADGDNLVIATVGDETYGDATFTLAGGKPPKPTIALADVSISHKGLEYKNLDTGERAIITSPGGVQTVDIDCLNKTVECNTTAFRFYGVFPRFRLGENNIRVTRGYLVNQKSADAELADLSATSVLLDATTDRQAQSFIVPYADETFSGITLGVYKEGTPGNLTWRIETDAAGEPSGTLAHANATGAIGHSSIGTSAEYQISGTASTNLFPLQANTVYWLVLSAAATLDANNKYFLPLPSAATYPRGKARFSTDSGSTWDDFSTKTDLSFRILYGGRPATATLTHTVSYLKTYL